MMRLRLVTPTGTIVDADDVVYVRAEDATGSFGIQPRHTDFVTALVVSVLSWRDSQGGAHYAGIRGGVLRVRDGQVVEVATREAVIGEPLSELEHAVLIRLRDAADTEAKARTGATQLHASVVRNLYRYVRAQRGSRDRALSLGDEEPQG